MASPLLPWYQADAIKADVFACGWEILVDLPKPDQAVVRTLAGRVDDDAVLVEQTRTERVMPEARLGAMLRRAG